MKNSIWFILIAVLLGAIAGAYWYRTTLARPFQLPEAPTGSAVELIDRLTKIKIDISFFEDSRFLNLDPFPTPSLEGVEKGKINPFSLSSAQ
jgi:hypothetical protein